MEELTTLTGKIHENCLKVNHSTRSPLQLTVNRAD